jgi:hypothetical protein
MAARLWSLHFAHFWEAASAAWFHVAAVAKGSTMPGFTRKSAG